MSLPTIEVIYLPATEAYRANPKDESLLKPAFDLLAEQKGHLQTYAGIKHEDKATAYVVVAWETLEDHRRLQENKELYPVLNAKTTTFFDVSKPPAESTMVHVRPTSEPYKALGAPVTEIAYFTPQAGHSKSEVEQVVDAIAKAMVAAGDAYGVVDAAWGPTVEKENTVGLFIGWTSVDAHWNAIKTNKTLADLIDKIKSISAVNLVHVELTKY
ncbi:hypothetical protein C8Q77DRAFT_1097451 [Trametes polyzona]|nr:hypothetical protein C8Q77DRAFT_1097451 [Trametes polyzona]